MDTSERLLYPMSVVGAHVDLFAGSWDVCLAHIICTTILSEVIRQVKNINFATSKVKKHNFTIGLYLWVYLPRDPKFDLPTETFYGELKFEIRSGFRAWKGTLKNPVFWDRKAITLRSGMLEKNKFHILIPRTRNHTSHISLYQPVFLGGFSEPKQFPAGTAAPVRAEILFGSVNPPKIPVDTKKSVELGFGYG